ncbi:craniofacial development protein 2-like [Drosophila ananassae]|uniref:craniofacial development protein 2-like n=1 Tax=Drosophila ananassae TaxID=7217 RepID=UPI001CFFA313|nr:craniofacial development protein 2-like [Drosophila ananassae]
MTTLRISKRTRIGQWNVRTLMEPSRLAQLENEMDRLQIAIAGISEMRWSGKGATTTSQSNLVLHSGSSDGGRNGVGIYVSRTLISWNPVSDRIITARFRCNARHITIVQCYAPTEDASDDIKDDFYNALISSLNKVIRGDIKILMGDFNAKVGPNNTGLESTMNGNSTTRTVGTTAELPLGTNLQTTEKYRRGDAWHETTQLL